MEVEEVEEEVEDAKDGVVRVEVVGRQQDGKRRRGFVKRVVEDQSQFAVESMRTRDIALDDVDNSEQSSGGAEDDAMTYVISYPEKGKGRLALV